MDLIAEEGIAAHWSYKEGKVVEEEDAKVVTWLRQMMEWQQDLDDPREFFENVRVDLYPDEVYVFTPKGEVKNFPKGASPLDFAYSIHTEVGHRCAGAKVNGKMVPLKYQLQTGDSVEIITSAHQKPSKDWLKYVKTGRARTKIRHYVLAEERQRAIQIGRESTERELRKWRIDLNRVEKETEILKIAQEYSFRSETDLYAAIGYGRISPKVIVTKLIPAHEREKAKVHLTEDRPIRKESATTRSGIRVQGIADVMINFAKCCNPLPGDPIKGFITRGRGITVHKADCTNLQVTDSIRLIDVSWDENQTLTRMVRLGITASNRTGLLATISGVFSSNDSDIVQANMKALNDHQAQGTFTVQVKNLDHLTKIMNALRTVKGVDKVERLGTI
jgi:GTP pyrophosphokinase